MSTWEEIRKFAEEHFTPEDFEGFDEFLHKNDRITDLERQVKTLREALSNLVGFLETQEIGAQKGFCRCARHYKDGFLNKTGDCSYCKARAVLEDTDAPSQTQETGWANGIKIPEWVRKAREHFMPTGTYRPEDLRRLLGDPNKGVEMGPEAAKAHFIDDGKKVEERP